MLNSVGGTTEKSLEIVYNNLIINKQKKARHGMKRLVNTTKVVLLGMTIGLSSITFAVEIEPGLDWQYKGSKHYDKALVVWTDDQAVGKREKHLLIPDEYYNAEEAVRHVRGIVEDYLETEKTIRFEELDPIVTADYNLGKVFAVEAIPTNVVQRITHDGWIYVLGRTGWGFSILVNLDEDGYITEYAMNDVGDEKIISRLFITDGISIHSDDLKVNHFTSLGKEAFKPKLSAIDLKLSDPNIRNRSIEPNLTIVSIDNAVQGHSYQVIDTKDLSSPFIKNELAGIKKADADGLLTFEVPLDPSDKVHFYKIELIE